MGIGSTYSPVVEIHGTVDHAGGEWVLREESFVSFPEEFGELVVGVDVVPSGVICIGVLTL